MNFGTANAAIVSHISFCQFDVSTAWKLTWITDLLLLGQQSWVSSARTPTLLSWANISDLFVSQVSVLLTCKSGFATVLGISSVSVHRINPLSADTFTFTCTCNMNTYLRTWLTCLSGWFLPNFSGLSVTILSLTGKALWCKQQGSPGIVQL